ncbi:MAG: hydrogenase nickel incorporation protein HypB [Betaproteobacteria bacterium]
MCTTCGCGQGDIRIDGVPAGADTPHAHDHVHADGTVHTHTHDHTGAHAHDDGSAGAGGGHWHRHGDGAWHSHVRVGGSAHVHAGATVAGGAFGAVHAAGMPPERIVQIERDILAKNDAFAARNRQLLADRGIFALNLVSSPGSGKTTLLVKTIEALRGRIAVAVVEGDQQTSLDADRIRATGAAAVQVNTGKGCHLDAQMVGQALASLALEDDSLLLIENVGNLVCPAAFDLGEAHKVVVLSVTEGDDKPLKYPDMFHAADLMIVNKVDLAPYVQFDVDRAIEYARRVRPGLEAIPLSATTGEGFDRWLAWLERGTGDAGTKRDASVAALRRRVAEPEAQLVAQSSAAPSAPATPVRPA